MQPERVIVSSKFFRDLVPIDDQNLGKTGGLHSAPPLFWRNPIFFHVSRVLRFRRACVCYMGFQMKGTATGQSEFALLHRVIGSLTDGNNFVPSFLRR